MLICIHEQGLQTYKYMFLLLHCEGGCDPETSIARESVVKNNKMREWLEILKDFPTIPFLFFF